ncbi:MAG: PEP-CTERM sorting domain-containing protein [Myxococcales bacterium]|nr:PEP-CTERM sorting domain-containing protein [Myxococcales bacterium]MDH5307284.1 PEP-CTERM sorting domain-containing protein [Myxococcales bacterium]MDH5566763.1 PEP-CTERM sorting domain-containing protein [Myxococcales bacterium]
MSKRLERCWIRGYGIRAAVRAGLGAALLLTAQLGADAASAATIEAIAHSFTGEDATVRIVLDDAGAGAGEILVTVEVTEGMGDIRGVFFDIDLDPTLLAGLSAIGSAVTSTSFGDVINPGPGSNLHGGGTPCPCDFGVQIGTPGIGKDDFRSVSFTLAHDTQMLSLSLFFGQDVGVRVSSAKLSGVVPVPEPSTATLLGLGLGALALRARRRTR